MANSKKNGKGRLKKPDNSVYSGYFKDDKMHG